MTEAQVKPTHKHEDSKTPTKVACVDLLNHAAVHFKGQTIVGGVTDALSIVVPCEPDGRHTKVHFYDFRNSTTPIATIANRGTATHLMPYCNGGVTKIHFSQKALAESMRVLFDTLRSQLN